MLLVEGNQNTWRNYCLCANLSNTKLAMNPCLRGDTPATKRLSHGTSYLTEDTHCLHFKANLLTLFRAIVAVYCEKNVQPHCVGKLRVTIACEGGICT
jgi:hypothetical protein